VHSEANDDDHYNRKTWSGRAGNQYVTGAAATGHDDVIKLEGR